MTATVEWGPDLKVWVQRLVKDAVRGEKLLLVSPYVQLERLDDLARAITTALERGVQVAMLVRGPDKDRPDLPLSVYDSPTFQELRRSGLDVRQVENLHAKLYLGPREALVSSLNLNEYSQNNSIELGVVIREAVALEKLQAFVRDELVPHARPFSAPLRKPGGRKETSKPPPAPAPAPALAPARSAPSSSGAGAVAGAVVEMLRDLVSGAQGHCIRCGDEIALDRARPYCRSDYAAWAEYENPDYEDRHCHGCGKAHKATMKRPFCKPCFKELG